MAIDLNFELEIAKARRAQAAAQGAAAPPALPAAPPPAPRDLFPGVGPAPGGPLPPARGQGTGADVAQEPAPGDRSYAVGGFDLSPKTKVSSLANPQPASPTGNAEMFPWGNDPLSVIQHAAVADAQAGLRGAADVAGAPIDIPLAITKLLGWGYNEAAAKPFGLNEFPNIDWSMGQTVADIAANLATKVGAPPMTSDQMTPAERTMQLPIELGAGAGLGGLTLASRAGKVAEKLAAPGGAKPSFVDKMSTPYLNRPVAASGRDIGAGVGSAVGMDAANIATQQDWFPDNTIAERSAQILSMLLGGVGGHTIAAGAGAVPPMVASLPGKYFRDPNIPVNTKTGQPYTGAQSDLAARVFQGDASDPAKAANTIAENTNALDAAGIPQDAQPTSALISGDQGLVNLEQGFRAKTPTPFIERDQAVKAEAAGKVASLTDPTADQSLVGPGIKNTKTDIAATRDMEALPLLMKAENSGAVVDAQPVVDIIDNMLAVTKRPPVVKALTAARGFLYGKKTDPKAPDVLDNSVSSLYEARKAIGDLIEGRADDATTRFADKELIKVRDALDAAIVKVAPDFGDYLTKFREGSAPLDAIKDNQSTQALINGEDPRNVAQGLFSGYGGEAKAKEITALVANDPAAAAGWKAAVAEVLANRVTGSKVAGEAYEAQYARLANEFKKNEETLAAVFSPEEMNTLRQAHSLLGYFKAAESKATTGSATAERLLRTSEADRIVGGPVGRGTEIVLKHIYGNLEGGGILRRFKLMVGLLPTERFAATEIAKMAFFNPEVAAYLLGKPVRNLSAVPNNFGLRAAIAAEEGIQGEDPNK